MLFTASFAGLVPNVGLGPYCVAKYGVVALAEVLARELRQHEIGVSVLCPMRVGTNIGHSERNRADDYGGADAGVARRRAGRGQRRPRRPGARRRRRRRAHRRRRRQQPPLRPPARGEPPRDPPPLRAHRPDLRAAAPPAEPVRTGRPGTRRRDAASRSVQRQSPSTPRSKRHRVPRRDSVTYSAVPAKQQFVGMPSPHISLSTISAGAVDDADAVGVGRGDVDRPVGAEAHPVGGVALGQLDDELRCAVDQAHHAAGERLGPVQARRRRRRRCRWGTPAPARRQLAVTGRDVDGEEPAVGCRSAPGSAPPRGSVNHSRPSGPKARSFGTVERDPADRRERLGHLAVERRPLDPGRRPRARAHAAVLGDPQRPVGPERRPVRPAAGLGDDARPRRRRRARRSARR